MENANTLHLIKIYMNVNIKIYTYKLYLCITNLINDVFS